MISEPPDSVRSLFLAAGWYPGRQMAVCPEVLPEHPAAAVLASFDGLSVVPTPWVRGLECGRNSIQFGFEDLYRCWQVRQGTRIVTWTRGRAIRRWESFLRTRLVKVAELAEGHGGLVIASDERCFGMSNVHEAFWFGGTTFAEAVEALLLGRRPRPMLLPDQECVTLGGKKFTHSSPELYLPHSNLEPGP